MMLFLAQSGGVFGFVASFVRCVIIRTLWIVTTSTITFISITVTFIVFIDCWKNRRWWLGIGSWRSVRRCVWCSRAVVNIYKFAIKDVNLWVNKCKPIIFIIISILYGYICKVILGNIFHVWVLWLLLCSFIIWHFTVVGSSLVRQMSRVWCMVNWRPLMSYLFALFGVHSILACSWFLRLFLFFGSLDSLEFLSMHTFFRMPLQMLFDLEKSRVTAILDWIKFH